MLLSAGATRADALDDLMQSLKAKSVISDSDYQRISTAKEAEKKLPATGNNPNAVSGNFKDAIVFSSADGNNTMQLTGRLQGDYRTYSNPAEPSTFEMRRVLLGVKGKFWNDTKYNVTAHLYNISGNGGQGALEEAWVEPFVRKQATLRIGQLYTPFSLEDANSSKYIDFMERAAIVNQSQSSNDSSDIGLMLYGVPVDGFSYWLARTNGASLNTTNTSTANGGETLVRGVADFAKIFGQQDAVYHLGIDYACGKKPGNLTAGAEIGTIRSEGRGASFRPMKLAGINNNYDRTRQDLELALAYGSLKFQSDIISENYTGTTLAGVGVDKTVRGHYANFMWMITGEKYADGYSNGSFGNSRPNHNFAPGSEGWGAWEIGLRFSRLDAGNLGSAAPAGVLTNVAGYASGMKGITLGIKWIMNPNTRVLVNYVHSKYDQPTSGGVTGLAPVSSDNAYMMRGQFDF